MIKIKIDLVDSTSSLLVLFKRGDYIYKNKNKNSLIQNQIISYIKLILNYVIY
jgi:hypothetical protein